MADTVAEPSLPLKSPRSDCEPAQAVGRARFAVREYRKLGGRAHARPGPNSVPAYLQRALVDVMTSTDRTDVYRAMITATEMVAELIEEGGASPGRDAVLRHVAEDLAMAHRHHPLAPQDV